MPPAAHGRLPPFVARSGLTLAHLAQMYSTPPSALLRIPDPMTAWMLDEAIGTLQLMLRAGYRLRPPETDNAETLRQLGVQIQDKRKKEREGASPTSECDS